MWIGVSVSISINIKLKTILRPLLIWLVTSGTDLQKLTTSMVIGSRDTALHKDTVEEIVPVKRTTTPAIQKLLQDPGILEAMTTFQDMSSAT